MTAKEMLLNEVRQVPEPLAAEVLDFVRFLRSKEVQERRETAIASQAALAKDWLRAEEDEAWRDL